jgi:lipopolysaccharide/colanic/teichoic acid biosynthesis glycosyltransferase
MRMAAAGRGLPRVLEVAIAALGLVGCSPVLLAAALAIKLTSKGPILFKQVRVGQGGVPFPLTKLRTMRTAAIGRSVTVGGDPRVTRVGRVLRHLKIDELPELWNVLRGDMALVGPRPELAEYVTSESNLWEAVLAVRPGMTDPVTVRLRSEEQLLASSGDDPERFYRETLQPFKLLGYATFLETRTWRSDLVVLWDTVRAVVFPGSVRPPSIAEMRAQVGSAGTVR